MTPQEKIKYISERCAVVNPEILEKKIGCVFKLVLDSGFHAELLERHGTSLYVYDGQSKLLCGGGWLDFNDMYLSKPNEWQILGRPIRLADVLAALRESTNHRGIGVDQDGLFIKPSTLGWNHWAPDHFSTPPVWNIYKDDLREQGDETITLIEKLLK